MGWGRVKNGTDAGWKPEKPKPDKPWVCPRCGTERPAWWLNCSFHPLEKRPY